MEKLGIDNLVLAAVGAYRIGDRIGAAAADGVQFTDSFALVAAFPDIQQIAPRIRPAFKELRDLSGAEALEFDRRVAEATGLPNDGSVRGKVRQYMSLTARTFDFTVRTYDTGKALVHEWGDLIGIDALRADDAVEL